MASPRSPQRLGLTSGRAGPLWELFFRFGPPRWSAYIRGNWAGQRLVIAVPYLWLLLFFLVPFLIVLKISFAELAPLGRPPYEPVVRWLEDGALQVKLVFSSYTYLLHEPLYVSAWLYSVKVALFSTVLCRLLGYPMAYAIARAAPATRNVLLAAGFAVALLMAAGFTHAALWALFAAIMVPAALIGRALFYVLVIPTTMPGAFFWRNRGFQEHARHIGLAEMPQVGVVPDAH